MGTLLYQLAGGLGTIFFNGIAIWATRPLDLTPIPPAVGRSALSGMVRGFLLPFPERGTTVPLGVHLVLVDSRKGDFKEW